MRYLSALLAVLLAVPALASGTDIYADLEDSTPPLAGYPGGFCATPRIHGHAAEMHSLSIPGAAPLTPADTASEPVVIDILFLYTPAALAGAGSAATLENQIRWALDEANFRYTNSGVNIHINPVYFGPITYAESGNMATDWTLLAGYASGGRGSLSRAATLRDFYKADVVYMITETDNFGTGGISDIAGATGNPDHAYGIVRRNYLVNPMVLAHEIGHLLGGQHDREHARDISGNTYPGAFTYSYGYRFEANQSVYITAMAYQPGMYVPYFSNPNLTFEGAPLGMPAGSDGEADNARTFNQLAPYVAAYRSARSRIEFADAKIDVSESDGMAMAYLKRSGDISTAASAVLTWETDSSAGSGIDYTRPPSNLVTFAAGEASAVVNIPLLENSQTTGDRVIHLSLASPASGHGLGLQSSTRVVIHDKEPSIAFDAPVTYTREAAGSVIVPINFTGGFGGKEQVDIEVHSGSAEDSAKEGTDFIFDAQTITFTPAHRRENVTIPIMDNHAVEGDRSFHLIAGNVTGEIRILDDDRNGSPRPETILGTNISPTLTLVTQEGKVLLAGQVADGLGTRSTTVVRLKMDGTADGTFHSPEFLIAGTAGRGLDASIFALALQPDGKILVCGSFAKVDGLMRHGLVRLNTDGTLDETFDAGLLGGNVHAVAVQPDGTMLIGGIFDQINGEPRTGFACLEANGALSARFAAAPRINSQVLVGIESVTQDNRGRIFLGGGFDKVNGVPQTNIVCITPDGEIDPTFDTKGGASGLVTKVFALPDGKIMVSGLFDIIAKNSYKRLARLNPNGSIDSTFRPSPAPNGEIYDFLTLEDGRIFVAGAFTRISSAKSSYLALLNNRGTTDSSFDMGSGPGDYCFSLALRGDGSLFSVGSFSTFDHQPAHGFARIHFDDLKPRLAAVRTSNSQLALTISGYPAGTYEVQASDNLATWNTLQRVTLPLEDGTLPISTISSRNLFLRLKTAEANELSSIDP
jgi:uncharacterized delta-60 repeat protein